MPTCGVIPVVPRRLALFALAAACSAPANPPPVQARPTPGGPAPGAGLGVEPAPPPPPDPELAKLDIDWATTSVASDADALAVWRRIVPTARDWELRVAQIPDDKHAALAGALLRAGNLRCPAVATTACTAGFVGYPEPAIDASFDDPCLRRTLALWAIGSLGNDVEDLLPTLSALAGDRAVDDEVVEAAVTAARYQPETARMDLIRAAAAAGHGAAVNNELYGLSSELLAEAATQLHIDAAVETLDVDYSRPVFLAAVRDRALRPSTRIDAIHELVIASGEKLSRELDKALTEATKDPDCTLAATAAAALVQLGKPHALPSRPRNRKPADAMRALCVMAAADLPQVAAAFVGPKGLKVVETSFDADLEFAPDDNEDGDNDPRTTRKVETVIRRDFEDIPFDTEIPLAMKSCKGTTCTVAGAGIELAFAFVPAKDGGLWLDTIERRDRGDCGEVLPQK
jgi:hypothetical protein